MNILTTIRYCSCRAGRLHAVCCRALNLIRRTGKADYLVSGQFSGTAFKEAQKLGYDVVCAATTKDVNFSYVPTVTRDMIRPMPHTHVLSITPSTAPNTATFRYGAFRWLRICLPVSCQSRWMCPKFRRHLRRCAEEHGARRRNGRHCPGGSADYAEPAMPTMLEWKTMADNDSMYNTPPAILSICWDLLRTGCCPSAGWMKMKARNEKKGGIALRLPDGQDYYIVPPGRIPPMMNVTFVTGNADQEIRR